MAFYNFPGNKRHDLSHYKKCITRTFRIMPNSKIIFFYEDINIFNLIKRRCKTKNIIGIKKSFNDLPTKEICKIYVKNLLNIDNNYLKKFNNNEEKGFSHYNELKICGEDVYWKILTVWTSKLYLVENVIKDNPFKTENFAWIDISLGKTQEKRSKWNWMNNIYENNKISIYPSNMFYYGEKINCSAGFIYGNSKIFINLINLYKDKFYEYKNDIYGHDEETILNLIFKEKNEIFSIIK